MGHIRRRNEPKYESAQYLDVARCAQKTHNVANTYKSTHMRSSGRFNAAPDNWKMTSPALCLHQTALTSFLLLPSTPNENHMRLTGNTDPSVMHNSLASPRLARCHPAARMSILTRLLLFQPNRSQVSSHYKACQGGNGVVKIRRCRHTPPPPPPPVLQL